MNRKQIDAIFDFKSMSSKLKFETIQRLLSHPGQLYSVYTRQELRIIEPLLEGDILGFDKQGRGKRIIVLQESKLRKVLEQCKSQDAYPDKNLPAKAISAYVHGNSKKVEAPSDYILLLNQVPGQTPMRWLRGTGTDLDVHEQCQDYGYAVLRIVKGDMWQTSQTLGLVENQDYMKHPADYLYGDLPDAIHFYGGNISNYLLDWLLEEKRVPRIVLYPDFDYVGFRNACKIQEMLEGHCEVHLPLPDSLEEYFVKQSSHQKLIITDKERNLLKEKQIFIEKYEALRTWYSLMDKYSVGVEQEAYGVRIVEQ